MDNLQNSSRDIKCESVYLHVLLNKREALEVEKLQDIEI